MTPSDSVIVYLRRHGFTNKETAEMIGMSESTCCHHWKKLSKELKISLPKKPKHRISSRAVLMNVVTYLYDHHGFSVGEVASLVGMTGINGQPDFRRTQRFLPHSVNMKALEMRRRNIPFSEIARQTGFAKEALQHFVHVYGPEYSSTDDYARKLTRVSDEEKKQMRLMLKQGVNKQEIGRRLNRSNYAVE